MKLQIPIKKQKYHPQLTSNQNHLANTPHFRIIKINNKAVTQTQKTNLIFTTINPQRHTHDRYDFRPQPRKDYRLFLGEKDTISFSRKSR